MKGASSSSSASRSESDKEKTKIRERLRRAITGKIFHGLRKHGGYRLSPRADINEVLRHLAAESGWTVLSDGTTFRSASVGSFCPACGAARQSATPTPTPTSSVVIAGGGGGECSTAASPKNFADRVLSSLDSVIDGDIPMAFYDGGGGGFSGGIQQYQSSSGGFHGGGQSPAVFQQQLHEARASNQNTPVGTPLRRSNYGS